MAVPSLALIGAGLFVRDQYVKILRELRDAVQLRYVWSRTQISADEVKAIVVDFSSDVVALSGEDGLQRVLEDSAVQAVAVVLPAQSQAEVVVRCLKAGKHVLQEKPVAATLAQALDTRTQFQTLQASRHAKGLPPLIWAVAENYRFEPALLKAAALVRESGKVVVSQVSVEAPIDERNPYFRSAWRRDPAFPGAFLTDGGVHFMAGLRLIVGTEPRTVTSLTAHMGASLPPPDTLVAALQMEDGSLASMSMVYCPTSRKVCWRVVAERATVEVERGVENGQHGYQMTLLLPGQPPERSFHPFQGVRDEIAAFVTDVSRTLEGGGAEVIPDPRHSHHEGIRDLAAIEAMLTSAAAGGAPTAIQSLVV